MDDVQKHYTQMTREEITFLKEKLWEVEKWKITKYSKKRIKERQGCFQKAKELIYAGKIIAFEVRNGCRRVLIRGEKIYDGKNACAIFQFEGAKIITFYWNDCNDNHKTIKMNEFDKSLKVIKTFHKLNYIWEFKKSFLGQFQDTMEIADLNQCSGENNEVHSIKQDFEHALDINIEQERMKTFEQDFKKILDREIRKLEKPKRKATYIIYPEKKKHKKKEYTVLV